MEINFKSLSGLYTGTKSLFKVGEAKLPKFIEAPKTALNVELFDISKEGTHFKDMYVFRDKAGNIIRKYIVKEPKVLADDFKHKTTRCLVDRFDYGRNGMDRLVTEDNTRRVGLTLDRRKTHQIVREETRIPFDYKQERYIPENPEHYLSVRDVGIERTVTSKISDKTTGANPVVSKTRFKQALNGNTITETSEIAEHSNGNVPKQFRAIREYSAPKGTYTRGINDFNGVNGELVIRPDYESITASSSIPTKTNDPYLFLRLHTNKKQFCSEAEPIIARKVGFKKTNSDPAYYERIIPKRHETDTWYKEVAKKVEYQGRTPYIQFSQESDVGGYVAMRDMINLEGNLYGKPIFIAEAVSNPFTKHTDRIHTLAHESTHLLDGRRMMLAQMPIGQEVKFDKTGAFTWETGLFERSSLTSYEAEALGGWIKPTSPEYAEIKRLREATLKYGVDETTSQGYKDNFLEIHANQKADEILADYKNTFELKKYFPNLTLWQLG